MTKTKDLVGQKQNMKLPQVKTLISHIFLMKPNSNLFRNRIGQRNSMMEKIQVRFYSFYHIRNTKCVFWFHRGLGR